MQSSFSDADVAAFTDLLAQRVAEQLKDVQPVPAAAAPVSPTPPGCTPGCSAVYFVQRVNELEGSKQLQKMRGMDTSTVSTKLTATRKKLRVLLQTDIDMPDDVRREVERILGVAAQIAQDKGYPSDS